MADLSETIKQNGEDNWLLNDDWSWFKQGWDCLLAADRNLIPGPGGRRQHVTYEILHGALVGLRGAMYSKGRYYFACDFEIQRREVGHCGEWEHESLG